MKSHILAGLFGIYFLFLFFAGPLWVTDTRVGWGWVLLATLSFGLAAGALFKRRWQAPPKNISLWLLGLLALAVVYSLLNGSNFLEEKWTHRWVTLLFLAGLLQWFKSPAELAAALRYPVLFFMLALGLESVYQSFFICPTSTLATSCFASRFYNINMLTQALLIGLVLLDFFKKEAHRKTQWLFDAAVFLSLLVIVYSQSRSAWLAISLYTASRLLLSKKEFWRYFLPLLLFAVLFSLDPRETAGKNPPDKAGSARYRLELVQGTLKMISEHPLGVGVNNFEFDFVPYRGESALPPTVTAIDKTPHSDFLLVLAEEGWVTGLAFILLYILLLLEAMRRLRSKSQAMWPGFLVIMLPEILFQFPSDMHFFAFGLAVVLAAECLSRNLSLRALSASVRVAGFTVVLLIAGAGVLRYGTFTSAKYSGVYCSLFHDAWKNCGYYFNYHLKRGDYRRAENSIVPVIRYQKLNYVMHHWDYLLYNPRRNPVIACNYAALFNFKLSIPTSDISACERNLSREEITQRISDYSRKR